MMMLAILLAVTASIYWTVRELILNTFKVTSRTKTFIIGFALAGLTIAVALAVIPQFAFRTILVSPWVALPALILCPSYLANIVFIDMPHPPLSMLVEVGLITAVMNTAFYAAIGGRVGSFLLHAQTHD
jgi:hypothetical protein